LSVNTIPPKLKYALLNLSFISGLRCNGHFPFLVTRLKFVSVPTCERLQTEVVGTIF
jgi:hypothetical protein